MPFTYALEPVAFTLGPLAVRWYSLVWVLGFLAAYYVLRYAARTGRLEGFTEKDADEYVIWLVVGTVVTARLFFVIFYNPGHFLEQPLDAFAVWKGGLSFHGGFLGAAIATLLFARRKGYRFYAISDVLVAPLALALVFGRIANYVNGELVGVPGDVAWCINYPWLTECRHPSQFYEAGKNLLVFAVLMPLWAVKAWYQRLREGTLLWLFVALYGLGRLLTDFWRAPDPTDPVLGGLLIGQWMSLAMALLGAAVLISWYRPRR